MRRAGPEAGMSLVEMLITMTILAVVCVVVTTIFINSSRLQSRTARRAEVQMSSRQGLSLLTTELRQAGADPFDPPIGLVGLVTANATQIRIRADLNGDGALQTTEPSEDVTYSYDGTAKTITRNPGAGAAVLVPNVTGLTFTYYNAAGTALTPLPLSAANAALVRTVGVSITSQDRDSKSITLTTRIALRNMD